MIWYSLNVVIERLLSRGYAIEHSDASALVFRGPRKFGLLYPRVTVPVNLGQSLPEPILRKLLSEAGFNVDELLSEVKETPGGSEEIA